MTYYRLIDADHAGTIIRADARDQQQYVPQKGWVPTALLQLYFYDESELYEQYEKIGEAEAMRFVGEQGA